MKISIKKIAFLAIILFYMLRIDFVLGATMKSPWRSSRLDMRITDNVGDSNDQYLRLSLPATAAYYLIRFYQRYISGYTGGHCPMYPSCSSYSREAILKYGFLVGYIMTCDRLMRCGHNDGYYPIVLVENDRYYFDPLPLADPGPV